MYKLDLEKVEKLEIKLPAIIGSYREQGNSKQHIYFSFIDYTKAFDCVGHKNSLLMRMKGESEKACLKLNIQKTNILTSSPITSWKINGGKWKQWHILFTWAPKITEDCDCSHEIKGHLLLGRKVVTKLDSKLKSRGITCQQQSIYSKLCFFQSTCMNVRVGT